MNFGIGAEEKVSEFVTVLYQVYQELTKAELQVNFTDKCAGFASYPLFLAGPNPYLLPFYQDSIQQHSEQGFSPDRRL
jgi:hypothetical protein